MKTTIATSIFILFISYASFAQLTPKTYVLGGGAGFSFNKSPSADYESKRTSFNISPGIGKFISEKYLLDGGIGYTFNKSSNAQSSSDYSNLQIRNSVNVRFGVTRFFPIADRFYFTLAAHIIPTYSTNYTQSSSFGSQTETESKSISGRLNIAPGLSYFVNKKWMIYTYVGALNYNVSYNLDTKQTGHNLHTSLRANSFGVGVRYILGGKTKAE